MVHCKIAECRFPVRDLSPEIHHGATIIAIPGASTTEKNAQISAIPG
jgi:hypothetical protein